MTTDSALQHQLQQQLQERTAGSNPMFQVDLSGFTITVESHSAETPVWGENLLNLACELRRLALTELGVAAHGVLANVAFPLSNAERTVVELVGQGLTNKQIAAQLYVSHRTVETHVSHALTKLSLTSRMQLIRLLALGEIGADREASRQRFPFSSAATSSAT